ncbi:MAG: outer membrane beta-barrel protein [Halioglobus sp.]
MSIRRIIMLVGLLAPMLVTGTSHAAEPGFYIGASGGQSELDQNANHFGYNGAYNIELNDNDTGWKAYLGYNFFPWLGVEGGYVDFGSFSQTVFADRVDADLSGWEGFLVGTMPVGPVDLFVKAGAINLKSEIDISNQGSANENDTQFAYGAGIAYNYGAWGLRLEAEGYDDNKIYDFYFLSGGITYHFGVSEPAPARSRRRSRPLLPHVPMQTPMAFAMLMTSAPAARRELE